MSIKFYPDTELSERIKNSKTFAGTAPISADLEEEMKDLTFQQFAQRLQKQLQSIGAVGIELISIDFAPIYDPENIKVK